jgi:hypothetical protein
MSQEDKLRIKLDPKFHKDAAAMQELSKKTGFSLDMVGCLLQLLAAAGAGVEALLQVLMGDSSTPAPDCVVALSCVQCTRKADSEGYGTGGADCCDRCCVHVCLRAVMLSAASWCRSGT